MLNCDNNCRKISDPRGRNSNIHYSTLINFYLLCTVDGEVKLGQK
jgi:hypothetical protein